MNLENLLNDVYFTKMVYELDFALKSVLCKASNQKVLASLKL